MTKPGPILALLFLMLGVLGWREFATERRLAAIAQDVSALRAEAAAGSAERLAALRAESNALRQLELEQKALLEKLAALAAAKSPPSLATLREAKPEPDAAAIEDVLKSAAPTGRVHAIEFLTQHEMLSRFGSPNVTLTKDGVVTWIYKLEGFERLLRCEFVDGVLLAAYDR